MDRRTLIAAFACWPAGHLLAQDEGPRPRHKISAGQLHDALSARFPVRLRIATLLELQVSAPRLLLLPARNQLGAGLLAQVSGLQLQPVPDGELDVLFSLRYEASDRTVRAHGLEIRDVRWPALSASALESLQRALPTITREAVGEIVLHTFSPGELALADTMGFEPEKLTVVDDGLVISFGPKPRR